MRIRMGSENLLALQSPVALPSTAGLTKSPAVVFCWVHVVCIHIVFLPPSTLDTFTIGDPDIGPYLFETFRPPIIVPI